MRHFANTLRASGWKVLYSKVDDPQNSQNILGEILRYADEVGGNELIVTKPGEWRLIELLNEAPLVVKMIEDDRFIASQVEFEKLGT